MNEKDINIYTKKYHSPWIFIIFLLFTLFVGFYTYEGLKQIDRIYDEVEAAYSSSNLK